MKKINADIFKTMLCVAAVMLVISLCGCNDTKSKTNDQPLNVAVVNASNANSVYLDMEEIQPVIADVCRTDGYFSYIIADGEGCIAYHDSIFIDRKGISENNYDRRVNSKAIELSENISTAVPKTEEVDLLKALGLAAKDMIGKTDPKIVVYSNGLSTVGKLDMTQLSSIDNLDVEATIEDLKASDAIPDLTGCSVQFFLTKAAGNQTELTDKEENLIAELWKSIVETGGGTFELNYYLPDSISVIDSAPYVTPVAVGEDLSCIKEVTLDNVPEELPSSFEVTIGEEDIAFVSGTANIKNEEKAVKKIAAFADTVETNHIELLLVGSTATYGEADSAVTLSEQRCQAIERLLKEAGVTTDIKIKGFGYSHENPYFTNDIENGQLVDSIAASNRKVVIIAQDSDQALQILK